MISTFNQWLLFWCALNCLVFLFWSNFNGNISKCWCFFYSITTWNIFLINTPLDPKSKRLESPWEDIGDSLFVLINKHVFEQILLTSNFERTKSRWFNSWPFHPRSLEVTNNLWRGHLTIPKRAQRIARIVCFGLFLQLIQWIWW